MTAVGAFDSIPCDCVIILNHPNVYFVFDGRGWWLTYAIFSNVIRDCQVWWARWSDVMGTYWKTRNDAQWMGLGSIEFDEIFNGGRFGHRSMLCQGDPFSARLLSSSICATSFAAKFDFMSTNRLSKHFQCKLETVLSARVNGRNITNWLSFNKPVCLSKKSRW